MSTEEIREWCRLTDKMLAEATTHEAPQTIATVRRLSEAFKEQIQNGIDEEATKQS